ncbi:hypothetical protein D9M72_372890 [compost metagenome]
MLCRTAGGTAPPDRFTQCRCRGQELLRGRCGQFIHPAFNQRQRRFQFFQCLFLGGRPLGHEDTLGQRFLDAFGVAGVDFPRQFLDLGRVNVDATGIGLDGTQEVAAEPGHLDEEPGVRRFPHRQEKPDIVLGQAQAFAELGHVGREKGHFKVGQRHPDVR